MAGEGNEEMAMGGVTVGNRTGMVGTAAESKESDARFKGEGRSDGWGSDSHGEHGRRARDSPELFDDGNREDGDGCLRGCKLESGLTCVGGW